MIEIQHLTKAYDSAAASAHALDDVSISIADGDIVGITMPVVKHSFLLQSTDDLTKTFREAFYIASTGRPGPVLIDIPSDLAGAQMVFRYPDHIDIPSYRPNYRGNAKQVKQAKQDGLIDFFVYGSTSASYLTALLDTL